MRWCSLHQSCIYIRFIWKTMFSPMTHSDTSHCMLISSLQWAWDCFIQQECFIPHVLTTLLCLYCTHAHEGLSQYKCIIYQRMHGFQTCLFENCIWTLLFDSWRSWREAVPIQSTGLQWHSSLHWYFTKHYKIFQETIQGKLCRVPMCRCRNI